MSTQPDTTSTSATTDAAQALLKSWDAQQTSYITQREQRFDMVLDIVAATTPSDGVLLDLACGPGSLTARALERFPDMRVIAVDYDPVLLELARHALGGYGDRVNFVDVDLADPSWVTAIDGVDIGAVASSTALHWLSASTLTRVYRELAVRLEPGRVFLNADHFRFDDGRTLFASLSARDDRRSQQRGAAQGAPSWDEWFEQATAEGPWAERADDRTARFADRHPNPDLSAAFHVEALRTAGFREAGTVWQLYDDYIVLAQR